MELCHSCGGNFKDYLSADLVEGAPPDKIEIPSGDVPDSSGSTQPARREFAPWCRWVYVFSSGGTTLRLYNNDQTKKPYIVSQGDLVPIPAGVVYVGHNGTAPSSDVVLEGLSHKDAAIRAPNRNQIRAVVVGGVGSTVLNGHDTPVVLTGDGAQHLYTDANPLVNKITIKASDGNASGTPFYVSDSAANANTAASRFGLEQGRSLDIYRRNASPITFGYKGVNPDTIELWRYLE